MSESLLLLDAGNTRLKWAVRHNGVLRDHGSHTYTTAVDAGVPDALKRVVDRSIGTDSQAATTADTHDAIEPQRRASPPARALIGSVASQAFNRLLSDWLDDQGIQVELARVRALPHLKPAYSDPSTFGVDRWLAMLGARTLYPGPVCVADCGTALTLDAVDPDGRHLGGMIMPGFDLMQSALLTRTARIDQADTRLPQSFFGTTTGAAVNAGATCSLAATLDRFVIETTAALSMQPVVVVTGGGRERLLRYAHCDTIEVPDLVLLGLASLEEGDA